MINHPMAIVVVALVVTMGMVGTVTATPGEGPPGEMPGVVPDFVTDLLGAISEFIESVLGAVNDLLDNVPGGAESATASAW